MALYFRGMGNGWAAPCEVDWLVSQQPHRGEASNPREGETLHPRLRLTSSPCSQARDFPLGLQLGMQGRIVAYTTMHQRHLEGHMLKARNSHCDSISDSQQVSSREQAYSCQHCRKGCFVLLCYVWVRNVSREPRNLNTHLVLQGSASKNDVTPC